MIERLSKLARAQVGDEGEVEEAKKSLRIAITECDEMQIQEEQEKTEKIGQEAAEEVSKPGNKAAVWKIKKGLQGVTRKKLPSSLFNDKGELLTGKAELLKEVQEAVEKLVNPSKQYWIGERDEAFDREIERRHAEIRILARRSPKWITEDADRKEMENFARRAYKKDSRAGPSGTRGGMIALGGGNMQRALEMKLEMITECGVRPSHWRGTLMV